MTVDVAICIGCKRVRWWHGGEAELGGVKRGEAERKSERIIKRALKKARA
jgi:hypothetical protein